ncbi:major cardiolipin synthase ClsA [Clostridium acetireducens DSM 10703]|jgi:cardiolipin synthase|uniref:Cardiolipin synthase n=1 Tax=Clostridium acetireducens DSM 10703 TaxID=1121290 RepID=A0A1E8EY99_9CLOT|nr:cardiolipin synthase [Clostridium acetireducens]OFI05933.1 major cardiolipin synthase ClsA [Clostridium acetireducens DSM 10703]
MNLSTLIIIINIVLIIFLIFFERRNPSVTWAWLLILTLFPILGFLVYLFLGQNLSRQKMFDKKIINDIKQNECIKNVVNCYKCDLSLLENKDIIKMHYRNAKALYTQNNEVNLYFNGEEKFNALFEEIKKAKKFIHMEYYIIQWDDLGNKLINLLTEKAKEGVEVKLLFDAMGSRRLNFRRKKALKSLIDAGGNYAVFFPSLFAFINKRINYRNHRKIVVIDSEIAFLGGFNVGDEYLGKSKKRGHWRDTHMKISGEAVNDLETRFLLDWIYAAKENIEDYYKYFLPKNFKTKNVGMQIVSSGPDHREQYIKNGYAKIINNAKNYLYIQSPYFVPDETLLDALKMSSLSGVDVRIMIPGNPDHKIVFWAGQSYISELLNAGIKVFLYKKGFIHCKVIMSDNSVCSIGTANMDIRSFKLNFETNAFIYNTEITSILKNQFIIDMKNSREINLKEFKNRPKINKILESITRLLSPIL